MSRTAEGNVLGFLYLITVTFSWYQIGRQIVSRVLPSIDPDLRDALSIAVGFTLLGYIVMIMGAFGLFSKIYLIILATVPFVFTVSELPRQLRKLHERTSRWSQEFITTPDLLLILVLVALFLLDIFNSGNSAVAWDAAVHHYAFPKALLRAGGLIDVPEIPFSYYPGQGEMLYTLGLGAGGVFLAGALSAVWFIPIILGFIAIGRSMGHPRVGLWSVLIFLGAPLLSDVPYSGLIDIQYFTCCLLAIAVILDTNDDLDWRKIIAAGILTGCAASYKHLGLLFLAAFVPILVWRVSSENKSIGMGLVGAIAVIVLTLLVPLPWYIRSFEATGNPVYPFLGSLFVQTNAATGSFSLESFARTDYPRTILGFFLYLWRLTMNYWDLRPWYWAISPAWLALLPASIWYASYRAKTVDETQELGVVRLLLILAFLATLINFFLAPAYPRYIYPTWICLSITSAWALMKIRTESKAIGKILVPIVLLFPFTIVMAQNVKTATEVWPQYWDNQAREDAILTEYPSYDVLRWANLTIDPESSLILSTDPKIYYLESPAIIATPDKESSLILSWDSDPEDILENWRDLGVTHFILDTSLISVKHGFGIALFTSIPGDRDAVWLDIVTTRQAADKFGVGEFLTDEEFLYMGKLGGLTIIDDGVRGGRHLFTRENADEFKQWSRDWMMAETILKFERAGIIKLEYKTYSGEGNNRTAISSIYSVHYPATIEFSLPDLPDVTMYSTPYEEGPVDFHL